MGKKKKNTHLIKFPEQIIKAEICPYCLKKTELINSFEIYGRDYGLMYICRPCDAFVACHKGTSISLGRVANKRLRVAKMEAHYWFDKIWKSQVQEGESKSIARKKAYKWLSKRLGVHKDHTHIGMFDLEFCLKTIEITQNHHSTMKTSVNEPCFKGQVIELGELQSGIGVNGQWHKKTMLIETDEAYPKKIHLEAWGDIAQTIDDEVKRLMTIKVDVSIESKEFKGKYYTNVKIWRYDLIVDISTDGQVEADKIEEQLRVINEHDLADEPVPAWMQKEEVSELDLDEAF